MSRVHIFTSAAANYLPQVKTLFHSIEQHHPEWQRHLLLVDEPCPQGLADDPVFHDIRLAKHLGIDAWESWAFCHTIVELCTAVKPFMLRELLARDDCDLVLYFDPDIALFSRLDEVVASLSDAAIVLTPHQVDPERSTEGVISNEICSLNHGAYNLGFIGVSDSLEGVRFATWWSERLYQFCRAKSEAGLFTDQRWIDLAPAFFSGVQILRSPRLNVAAWNISTRRLVRSAGGDYLVDDQPLGFYHFTSAQSGNHRLMLLKHALDFDPLDQLLGWYCGQLDRHRVELASKLPGALQSRWCYDRYTNGTPIKPEHRLLYHGSAALQRRFPNPFASAAWQAWIGRLTARKTARMLHGKAIAGLSPSRPSAAVAGRGLGDMIRIAAERPTLLWLLIQYLFGVVAPRKLGRFLSRFRRSDLACR